MKKLSILILSIGITLSSFGQGIDLGLLLEGGIEDANTYLESYLEPAFVGFGYAANSGWYNTGKPHKTLGFDITTGVNVATVPTDARFFTFNNDDFTNFQLTNGSSADMPTLFGPNLDADDIPEFRVFDSNSDELLRTTGPTGLGIEEADFYPFENPGIPAPFAQLGIGIVKNTELKLRLVPQQNVEGATYGAFGIGVMHDIKQWIPGMKLLPFDLSAFIGYNRVTSSFEINEEGTQTADLQIGGTTIQAVASKKLALLTVYGGLGFMSTAASFAMKGDFITDEGGENEQTFTDPVDFDYSAAGMRANVGARIKLAVLTIHAEYALQKYNTLTVGLGISVR